MNGSIDERALHIAAAVADGARDLIALVDSRGVPRLLNAATALTELLGYGEVRTTASWLVELVHPEDVERVRAVYYLLVRQPGTRLAVQYRLRHRDGHYVQVESSGANRLHDTAMQTVIIHTRAVPVLDRPSLMDEPTSPGASALRDEASFLRALSSVVQRKHEQRVGAGGDAEATTDPRTDYCVLLIELERYKMLLGSHGHLVVEGMLEQIAERLHPVLGRRDVLAHRGGGELGILVRGLGDNRRATHLADRIQDIVGEAIHVQGQTVSTSAIIGIATSSRSYARAEDVMSDAAAALNRARQQHRRRRRAAFQTKMRVEDKEYIMLIAELPSALQKQQFVLHYQPIVSFATGQLTGFEALVRWQHPERGLIAPIQFIPLAEQTGFIVDLGKWVLREACRQMVAWQADYPQTRANTISVNISAEQLSDDLPTEVQAVLTETSLDPRLLKLETTESAVMKNRETAAKVLTQIQHAGVRWSVDDFGTGYNSLTNLQELPYHTLKIDRSFIARLGQPHSRDDVDPLDLVAAMINLAHALKLKVVAEGVETAEQMEALADLSCDEGQGFHFARPQAAQVAAQLLASPPRW